MARYSVVEYFGESDVGHKCGYCRGKKTSLSSGMWGHYVTVQDYQGLIDRGWRRSGKYIYKPSMSRTCCPQYTIKCVVSTFTPTKAQKKVIKRFRNFVIRGGIEIVRNDNDEGDILMTAAKDEDESSSSSEDDQEEMGPPDKELDAAQAKVKLKEVDCPEISGTTQNKDKPGKEVEVTEKSSSKESMVVDTKPPKKVKAGAGADPNKPKARKAKELRRERARLKGKVALSKKTPPAAKTLEDLIDEPFPSDCAHRFEIRTVPAQRNNRDFEETYAETLRVYQKYQMSVHGDSLSKCSDRQFTRFLCDASIASEGGKEELPPHGYGAFHQQYLLDGKIFCVGVIDILPACVSSVYLFYDPDYAFLSPGTLSSLYEIAFIKKLSRQSTELCHYYMGFYIHTCPKMRYKAQYSSSFLLCPESYEWLPVKECLAKLDKAKYSRLSGPAAADADMPRPHQLDETLVLYERRPIPFGRYKQLKQLRYSDAEEAESDCKEVHDYARLVGMTLASNMLLYRSSS